MFDYIDQSLSGLSTVPRLGIAFGLATAAIATAGYSMIVAAPLFLGTGYVLGMKPS